MKNCFFTLIHGGTIQIAPQLKVIPAEEFSTLIDAKGVMERVQEDVKSFKMHEGEELERLKAEAQREGYADGFKAWSEAIAQLETEIHQVRSDIEKTLAPIALKAAKKIVGRELELHDDAIVDIVASSLKAVSQHRKITIYVNKRELSVLEANRPRLKEIFEMLESLSIRDRSDVAPGGCIIETEVGIINAQLDNQWRILEKAFENLLKQQSSGH